MYVLLPVLKKDLPANIIEMAFTFAGMNKTLDSLISYIVS